MTAAVSAAVRRQCQTGEHSSMKDAVAEAVAKAVAATYAALHPALPPDGNPALPLAVPAALPPAETGRKAVNASVATAALSVAEKASATCKSRREPGSVTYVGKNNSK